VVSNDIKHHVDINYYYYFFFVQKVREGKSLSVTAIRVRYFSVCNFRIPLPETETDSPLP
jgi:hypothetical protein